MKTKFKDVAHLYLGCDCLIDNQIRKLDTVAHAIGSYEVYCSFCGMGYECSDIKPILRPLSDITNDEFDELSKILEQCDYEAVFQKYNDGKTGVGYMWQEGMAGLILNSDAGQYFVKIFPFLLSRSFDLFGLIESGEAIDKTKL